MGRCSPGAACAGIDLEDSLGGELCMLLQQSICVSCVLVQHAGPGDIRYTMP